MIDTVSAIKILSKSVSIPPKSDNHWIAIEHLQLQFFLISWNSPHFYRDSFSDALIVKIVSLANNVMEGDDLAAAEEAGLLFQALLKHSTTRGSNSVATELISNAMQRCRALTASNQKDGAMKAMRFLAAMIEFGAASDDCFRLCSGNGVVDELFRVCRGLPPPSLAVRSISITPPSRIFILLFLLNKL